MNDRDAVNLKSLQAQLFEEAQELQLNLSAEQAQILIAHLAWVLEANKTTNLTRITDPTAAITLHIVDSLLFVKAIQPQSGRSGAFIDIGTGAGYPGVPFAVVTGMQGVLLDATQKKITTLNSFLTKAGLDTQIQGVAERVESYTGAHTGGFTAVLARAVAPLAVLLEYATPLLAQGGRACFSKGRISKEELEEGLCAAEICGMRCVSRETYELPHQSGTRELLSFVRDGEPKVDLPRRTGVAAKRPLGR